MDFSIIKFAILFFIGFANALPIPLMGSVLSIWMMEAGFEKDAIGLFALFGLPLSFKCLWSVPVDHVSLPFFKESPRKGWILFALMGMALSFLGISFIDPSIHSGFLAIGLISLSLFTGCLYIVGISYELESIDEKQYGFGSSCVVTGYRIGLLCAGAGALYMAFIWDWGWMFRCMAILLIVGCGFILLQPEPAKSKDILQSKQRQFSQYTSLWTGFWEEIIKQPCLALFRRGDWMMILFILITFKLGDHLAKTMTGPFLISLGFDKADLALATKMWGFVATIVGTLMGGMLFKGKDPLRAAGLVGFIHALMLGSYYMMTYFGKSYQALYITVALENFTGGMAMSVFIFLLWRVCDKRYAPMQYTLLWSFYSLKADLLACLGGLWAAYCSWSVFFLTVALFGLASALFAWRLIRNSIDEKAFA